MATSEFQLISGLAELSWKFEILLMTNILKIKYGWLKNLQNLSYQLQNVRSQSAMRHSINCLPIDKSRSQSNHNANAEANLPVS